LAKQLKKNRLPTLIHCN